VLEIGSGGGELLAALRPSRGVGVDVSGGMVALARSRHPELRFEQAAGETYREPGRFDQWGSYGLYRLLAHRVYGMGEC